MKIWSALHLLYVLNYYNFLSKLIMYIFSERL